MPETRSLFQVVHAEPGFPMHCWAIPFKAHCWSGGGRWPGTVWTVRIKSLLWSLRENEKSSSPSHPNDVYFQQPKGRSPNTPAHTHRSKRPACPHYGAVATTFCIFCLRNREKTSSIISLINFQKLNPVAEEEKKKLNMAPMDKNPQNRLEMAQ